MNLKKCAGIKTLLLDVDGVLTKGEVVYDDQKVEIKAFNVKDGLGLRLFMDAGFQVGVVTGRRSAALIHRCDNLGIHLIFDNVHDKAALLNLIVAQTLSQPEEIAFVGDDLPDLPLLLKVGLSIAVADAHKELLRRVDWVTAAPGGHGAVREICETLLKAKGLWDAIIAAYTSGLNG